jgi:isopentenyldiphosphate isomerase
MVEENVILVNHNDEQIGLMPKLEAHEKQFYIVLFQFCFKQQNDMLQQRASQNTIRHCYGPTVAVTSAMEKLIFKQEVVVYLKKWV